MKRSSSLWLWGSLRSLTFSLHISSEKNYCKHEAESANDYVADSKKVVPATHNVSCRENEGFGTVE